MRREIIKAIARKCASVDAGEEVMQGVRAYDLALLMMDLCVLEKTGCPLCEQHPGSNIDNCSLCLIWHLREKTNADDLHDQGNTDEKEVPVKNPVATRRHGSFSSVVIEYRLRERGFAGLRNQIDDCSCMIGDIAPCGKFPVDCVPGFKKMR